MLGAFVFHKHKWFVFYLQEDEEFEGFTPEDLRQAERKLDAELDKYVADLPQPKVKVYGMCW